MTKISPDKLLALLYLCASLFGLTLLICGSLVWGYWEKTLNVCQNDNCGCILFGMWTFSTFYGGKIIFCRYFVLSLLPVVIWSILMFLYHQCFPPSDKKKKPEIIDVRLQGRVLLKERSKKHHVNRDNETEIKKRRLYLPLAMAITSLILVFSSSVILSHGYDVTCSQYKKSVVEELKATGNMAVLVFDRFSCSTAFDFMDYLTPDPPDLPQQYRRGSWLVNTGLLLNISLFCDWITCIIYAFVTTINISLCATGKSFFFK